MALIDRTQHPSLNDNLDFRKDLAKVLKKYNAKIVSTHDEDLQFIIEGQGCYSLNENNTCCATADNINGLEPKKSKKKRNRKPKKNALRRWIYEYDRYNPQNGTSTRKGEVYACTKKAAEKIAKIVCDSYNTYGYLIYNRLLQVSDPIIKDEDVEVRNFRYEDRRGREKSIERYYDKYPLMHSDGWDKLHDITEAD